MSDFVKYLKKISDEFKILNTDIDKIIAKKKNEAKDNVSLVDEKVDEKDSKLLPKSLSLKSLQPRTKLYKNKQEMIEAKKNPEFDFIKKQIEEILK